MIVEHFQKGDTIYNFGSKSNKLSLVAAGNVVLSAEAVSLKVSTGFILGYTFNNSVVFPYSVRALDDVTLHSFEFNSYKDLKDLVLQNKSGSHLLTFYSIQNICVMLGGYAALMNKCSSMYSKATAMYEQYVALCSKYEVMPQELAGLNELSAFASEAAISPEILDYYAGAGTIDPAAWKTFVGSNADLAAGSISKIHSDINLVSNSVSTLTRYQNMISDLYITDFNIDLYTFFLGLFEKAILTGQKGEDIQYAIEELKQFIDEEVPVNKELISERSNEYEALFERAKGYSGSSSGSDSSSNAASLTQAPQGSDFPEHLNNSLCTILSYAGLDDADQKMFSDIIEKYKNISENSGRDEESRKIRQEISKCFYKLYEIVFFKVIKDPDPPGPVMMFMYFGYLDENLAGKSNAALLLRLASRIKPDPKERVFTFYDWLKAIFYCKKEPSVNEFNMDYTATLHKKRVEGSITESQEKEALKDGVKRVQYEIANMFRSTSKGLSSHVTTFVPVLTEEDIYKPLDKALLTYTDASGVLDLVRKIDFSLFFRETTYSNLDIGVTKELVQKEVVPDIILMPVIGARGSMWQEITGKIRTTPGRFILPIFLMEDLPKIMIHMCGEFRWELCRRIQGTRWNDVSERSLTSDYCDYIETYRKNKDLSPEQKEKLKTTYQKCRNSTKELFARDYVDFVFYEASGSLRLNKVSRAILFTYCPFSKDIRQSLEQNGMYKEVLERFKIKRQHALHLSDLSMQRIEKSGHAIPPEIKENRRFLTL